MITDELSTIVFRSGIKEIVRGYELSLNRQIEINSEPIVEISALNQGFLASTFFCRASVF